MTRPRQRPSISESETVESSNAQSSTLSQPPSSSDASMRAGTPSQVDEDTMTATSTTSSPRSLFSNETLDLLPAEQMSLTEGPPTTTPLLREDGASPPPAYSLHQPPDSVPPAAESASFHPEQAAYELRAQDLGPQEAQPLIQSASGQTFTQGSTYRAADTRYGAIVQFVNNYSFAPGPSNVLIGSADADAESQRFTTLRRVRRVKAIPPRHSQNLCRCCCWTCSRLTFAIILILVISAVLCGVGLGNGLKEPHTPRRPDRPRMPEQPTPPYPPTAPNPPKNPPILNWQKDG